MTVDLPDAIVIGAYVAMGLELAFLAVPSVVAYPAAAAVAGRDRSRPHHPQR